MIEGGAGATSLGLERELHGRYRIVSKLGSGAGGETFEAVDLRDETTVALKRLALADTRDWKAVDLFEREARVLAGLRHPAIPRLRESFVVDAERGSASYLAHDFAPGRSLRGWVEAGWRPDEAEIVRIACFLLDVLGYLHTLAPPVIHRDIKPANVIRSDDGRLWLVDFGAVRDTTTTMTGGSTIVGTYGYMAPEQFRGHAVPASDLYGVGATILYLLGGRSPTELPQEKLKVSFRGRVPCSPALAAWLDRSLEPAPEDRFASSFDALAALRTGAPARRLGAKAAPRGRVIVLLTILGGLLVGSGAFFVHEQRATLSTPTPASFVAPPARLKPFPPRPTGRYAPLRKVRNLEGNHTHLIFDMAISTDDAQLATGSDGIIKLWNLARREPTHSMAAHGAKVTGVAFTRDGARLLTSGGKTVQIWETASGKSLSTLDVAQASALRLSPDDRRVVVGSFDGSVAVYDVASLERKVRVSHGSPVYAVALSPTGSTFASGARDGSLKLWSLDDGRLIHASSPHSATINDLAFTPDGSLLASAGDDRKAIVSYVRSSGDIQPGYSVDHTDEVWGLAFSPDGKLLVTASKDTTIGVTDAMSGQPLPRFQTRSHAAHAAFTHDGRRLLVGTGKWIEEYSVAYRGSGTRVPSPEPSTSADPPAARDRVHALYLEAMRLAMLWPSVPLEQADAKVAEAIRLDPRSSLAWVARAQMALKHAYRNGDDYEPIGVALARRQLDYAATLGPKGVEWWSVEVWLRRAQKDFGAARDAIQKALAIAPDDPYTLLGQARLDVAEDRFAPGIASMSRLVQSTRRPEILSWAYWILADAYESLGDIDASATCRDRQIEADPKDPWAHGNYAWFLLREAGEPARAVEQARQALALSDYGNGRSALSAALVEHANELTWRDGDPDLAMREYDEAIRQYPKSELAYYGRAAVHRLRALRDHEPRWVPLARADLAKAKELDPELREVDVALSELDAVADAARKK